MKKVILVHGWGGSPDNHWFPSVAKALQEKGFNTEIPEMPNTNHPEIEAWVNKLKEVVQKPDKDTNFIGHSIGCQAIMRYLESLDNKIKVGKIVFVAPFFGLNNLDANSEKIAKPWIETPIDLDKVKSHIASMTAIFSDNDEDVSLSEKEVFKAIFDAKIIVEHNKGHFTAHDGVNEFPLVVQEVVTIQ